MSCRWELQGRERLVEMYFNNGKQYQKIFIQVYQKTNLRKAGNTNANNCLEIALMKIVQLFQDSYKASNQHSKTKMLIRDGKYINNPLLIQIFQNEPRYDSLKNQPSNHFFFLRIWSYLLNKSFMENFIFCTVQLVEQELYQNDIQMSPI